MAIKLVTPQNKIYKTKQQLIIFSNLVYNQKVGYLGEDILLFKLYSK